MAFKPKLIFCGGGNKSFYESATRAGFLYGSRLPDTIYGALFFADQDWVKPNRAGYMKALEKHKPTMATVLDWEYDSQQTTVLDWAEEASQYAKDVVVIPKIPGSIPKIPKKINGKRVVLGYSVPTSFGSSPCALWEFAGWPVHLLGGSPYAQRDCYSYLSCCADVVSIDGNYWQKMATKRCQFFDPQNRKPTQNRKWPTLQEADGHRNHDNGPAEAFKRSCYSVMAFWRE